MRDMMRLIATLTIWVVFATVMGVALSSPTGPLNNADGGQITGIVAIMAAPPRDRGQGVIDQPRR